MNFVSIVIIVFYLVLPAACLAHPCSPTAESTHSNAVVDHESGRSAECPVNHDDDDCETTCCCAGHTITPVFSALASPEPRSEYVSHEPYLALPTLVDRIFIPPRPRALCELSTITV